MLSKTITTTADLFSRRNASSLANTIDTKCKDASVYFETTSSNRQVNAKSILGLLSLACEKNAELKVVVSGKTADIEEQTLNTVESWFKDNAEGA